jgi:hypothetical protein
MMRTIVGGCGFVAIVLMAAGCDAAKTSTMGTVARRAAAAARTAADDAKDAAGKAVDAAKDAVASAKEAVSKKIEEGLPKIQDKINALSGDAKIKAQEKFDELKKSLSEFKETAPDKWEALKAKATEQFDELKKLVGMDK